MNLPGLFPGEAAPGQNSLARKCLLAGSRGNDQQQCPFPKEEATSQTSLARKCLVVGSRGNDHPQGLNPGKATTSQDMLARRRWVVVSRGNDHPETPKSKRPATKGCSPIQVLWLSAHRVHLVVASPGNDHRRSLSQHIQSDGCFSGEATTADNSVSILTLSTLQHRPQCKQCPHPEP